jgi:hypothetical protein
MITAFGTNVKARGHNCFVRISRFEAEGVENRSQRQSCAHLRTSLGDLGTVPELGKGSTWGNPAWGSPAQRPITFQFKARRQT